MFVSVRFAFVAFFGVSITQGPWCSLLVLLTIQLGPTTVPQPVSGLVKTPGVGWDSPRRPCPCECKRGASCVGDGRWERAICPGDRLSRAALFGGSQTTQRCGMHRSPIFT